MKDIIAGCKDYFDRPEISNSMLQSFREGGSWSYYHRYILKTIEEKYSSDALRIGSAMHNYVEYIAGGETGDSGDYVVVLPDYFDGEPLNLRKKAHRELVADYKELAGDTPCVTPEEMEGVTKMVASMWSNPAAKAITIAAGPDTSEVVCVNEIRGIPVKAKADLMLDDILVDYKTTRHATKDAFVRDAVWKYKYHRQAAHYLDVFEAKQFIIIAVRNFEPYEAIVYEVPGNLIDEGREANHNTLDDIKYCSDMDSWHSPGWGAITHLMEDE